MTSEAATCVYSTLVSVLVLVTVSDFSFYVSVQYYPFTCLTEAVSLSAILLNGRESLFRSYYYEAQQWIVWLTLWKPCHPNAVQSRLQ